MKTITTEEISNRELSEMVKDGDIVGKHRYEGGQCDWYLFTPEANTNVYAWYGAPGPAEQNIDEIEAFAEYKVIF